MLRIGFIIPHDNLNFKPFKNQQLTALYLLTILEKTFGDRVRLSVIDLRRIAKEDIEYYLPQMDVYCYTVFSPLLKDLCQVKNSLRRLYPKAVHIAGGPHIELFPKESSAEFDTISLGEGEENIVLMIKDVFEDKLKHKYKNDEVVDLNLYPYPDRKYQPFPAVVDTDFFYTDNKSLRAANVLFSRGCPFRCHFCANLNFGPTRFRAPELIVEEIEYLKSEYSVEALVLRDDNAIPFNQKIAKPFLKAIGKTNVKWRGQSRSNGISEDIVELAAESGCLDIAMGIESVLPEVLKIINKKIDLEQTKAYIKLLKKYGIRTKLLLILGLPGEKGDIVDRTLEFIDETDPDIVGLALFCPFPGSFMTSNYRDFGIKSLNPNLDEYKILFGRFDENEAPGLMFEYEEITPWGKGMSNEKIIKNYSTLQTKLRDRGLTM